MVAEVFSGMIQGIEGQIVQIQADISNGLPNFYMTGYLSNEVKESKERVRTALHNIGIALPPKRISVNFAPADFRKCGTFFDLAVAVAILLAMNLIPETYVKNTLFIGELSLNGQIRPISGVLPIVVSAVKSGIDRCIVAKENIEEAAFVDQMEVVSFQSLEELYSYLRHGYIVDRHSGEITQQKEADIRGIVRVDESITDNAALNLGEWNQITDFSEVKGQSMAKRAMEIAAAGYHNLMLGGPPGVGKTMLASCISGIMPQMTTEEKAQAFLEGRYAKGESGQNAGPGDGMPDGNGPDGNEMPGEKPDGIPDRNDSDGEKPDGAPAGSMPGGETSDGNAQDDLVTSGMGDEVGTPDAGTTQSAGTKTDSSNYSSYEEMLESYESDIASIEDGDKYGNNIVDLYNPINYIGDEDTESPTWTRIVMGASEGDMSLFASMNMQIAWLNSGTDAKLEWQWDGGHVPSEILGESLALYVDEMYGQYVEGAVEVTKAAAQTQTENGTATEATGTNISSWVSYENGEVNFTLKDAASYRTKGASKATPGFDVMDYGQETYEFGSSTQDARHFDKYVLKVLQENAETLSELFNSEEK